MMNLLWSFVTPCRGRSAGRSSVLRNCRIDEPNLPMSGRASAVRVVRSMRRGRFTPTPRGGSAADPGSPPHADHRNRTRSAIVTSQRLQSRTRCSQRLVPDWIAEACATDAKCAPVPGTGICTGMHSDGAQSRWRLMGVHRSRPSVRPQICRGRITPPWLAQSTRYTPPSGSCSTQTESFGYQGPNTRRYSSGEP
jgi:hypothetical protein